jgi:putative transposase
MADERLPVQSACEVLGVSDAGYYEWLKRGPSARSVRDELLTGLIVDIHANARGVYGARRVHAELTKGHGLTVCRGSVERLMNLAGIKGLPGPGKWKNAHQTPTAADLVDRDFVRTQPNQLWVTDIVRHEALSIRVEVGDLHRLAVAAAG